MKRLHGLGDCGSYRGCFLSIGNFDGVHLGHQIILRRLVSLAQEAGAPSVAMTFEPHPLVLLRPGHVPPRLTSARDKARLLGELGVDVVLEYPTDADLLKLTPGDFFQRFVVEEFDARGLVEGPNFCFGKGRAGTVETLRSCCEESGRRLEIVEPEMQQGEIVSSSQIRQALLDGNVAQAALLLGRRYRLTGVVSRGAGRGRTLGIPTANLEQIETLLPALGVYAGWCRTSSQNFMAAVNVGPNPTFGEGAIKVETHLLDFTGDLYGQSVDLELAERVRAVEAFASPQELQSRIREDLATVQSLLSVETPLCNEQP